MKQTLEKNEGSLLKFAEGYKKFGFNRTPEGIQFREWAPGAQRLWLAGDFNGWNRDSHECKKDEYGVFSLFLPDVNGKPAINHKTKVKLSVLTPDGHKVDRNPAWCKVLWQERGNAYLDGVYWEPPKSETHTWKFQSPKTPQDLRIYEAHVGMSSVEPKISTYLEFKDTVLPMIAKLGYNAIQLMGIMEHAYYASFGYQVTNFFAVSSRFGTPEELKQLIDRAHELGLLVLLDLVHSHASKNAIDGLNQLDGTDHQYFHGGLEGQHPIWDSRLFNYGLYEVLRFLLSNARFYIDEYHFDGFRFDGVTSMLYKHHGVNHSFVDGYHEYFRSDLVNEQAVLYMKLCNDMLHSLRDGIVTIAEDVSGFATLCRPLSEGGVGFDYRLAMGIPDKWIELFKTGVKDEDWNMGAIVWTLTNRRYLEKNIAYAESHDQSLVGDKTIAFWLMDKDMYTNMSVLSEMNAVIDRGMALHKMIRLVTCALGGEGYLNFMGNEFGHPEWIDFPREGNNDSYHYARRRWDLPQDDLLRYKQLWQFDQAMNLLEDKYKWLASAQAYVTLKHEDDKLIVFERGNLFWIFNFHWNKSFNDYRFGVLKPGKYKIVLNSDETQFGGHNRLDKNSSYFSSNDGCHGQPQSISVYIPCRTAIVLVRE
eukprot:TRINITY_DN6820_c0_g1_i3.p1 TRINITY_DN6820_c0_g1~~TRINITY_DN6820_c0_g1_i3.p1  ORF type:complete len:714 (+),score=190.48 TRINITY_DN6820_c0_g1_i3:203-2143(+)